MNTFSLLVYRVRNLFKNNFKKGSYYRKSLVIVLLATLFPIAAGSIVAYIIGTRQVKEEVQRIHSIQLRQAYNDIDRQLVHLELVGNEWAFNPLFSNDLKDIDLGVRFDRTNEIVGGLRVLQGSSPFIYDVRLYISNSSGDAVMSHLHGLRYAQNEEAEVYRELLKSKNNYLWVDTSIFGREDAVFPKTLIHKIPGSLGDPYGLLIFFLDKKTVESVIGQLNTDNQGAAFILDSLGEWITGGDKNNHEHGQLEELIRQELLKKNETSGSFSFKNKNINYLVTYETLSRNGWEFIVATPLSHLMAPVNIIAKLMLVICIILLLMSGAVSFFASGNIYKPIGKLLGLLHEDLAEENTEKLKDEIQYIEEHWKNIFKERMQLRSRLELSRDSLKKGFLLQMVLGHLCFLSREELNEQFRQYWWEPENKVFSVLIVKISGYYSEDSNFLKGDEQLVTFASANITEEILSESEFEATVVNFHDLSLAVVFSFPSEESVEKIKTTLLRISEKLNELLTSFLKVQVTIAVSRQINSLPEISKVLDETRQVLHYRDMNKKEQIIDIESLISFGDYKASYPFAIEKNFLDCLRMGMEVEALSELESFIEKMKDSSGKELLFKQGILQLLGSLMHMLNKAGINTSTLSPGADLYDELGRIYEPKEVLSWFRNRIVVPYIHEVLSVREQTTEMSVRKVLDILASDYNTPISLESCADIVGMTPYNLSKEFKSYAGSNFIDYLTEIRLTKAKDFLQNSSYTMNEIAEKVGYQSTYFVRIFKKVEGVTPGQYRKNGEIEDQI